MKTGAEGAESICEDHQMIVVPKDTDRLEGNKDFKTDDVARHPWLEGLLVEIEER